jgi:hypothetical protein
MVDQHSNQSKQARSSKDTSPIYGRQARDVIADVQNMNEYLIIAREANGTVRAYGSDERLSKELYSDTAKYFGSRT